MHFWHGYHEKLTDLDKNQKGLVKMKMGWTNRGRDCRRCQCWIAKSDTACKMARISSLLLVC